MAHLPAATVRPELLLLAAPALAPGADQVAEGAVVDVAVAPSVVVSVAGVVLALSVDEYRIGSKEAVILRYLVPQHAADGHPEEGMHHRVPEILVMVLRVAHAVVIHAAAGEGLGRGPGLYEGAAPAGVHQADGHARLVIDLLPEEQADGGEAVLAPEELRGGPGQTCKRCLTRFNEGTSLILKSTRQ